MLNSLIGCSPAISTGIAKVVKYTDPLVGGEGGRQAFVHCALELGKDPAILFTVETCIFGFLPEPLGAFCADETPPLPTIVGKVIEVGHRTPMEGPPAASARNWGVVEDYQQLGQSIEYLSCPRTRLVKEGRHGVLRWFA
jgi:hypothetical protein